MSERVVLTRSNRVGGSPTLPSRWLMRMDAVLDGAGVDRPVDPDAASYVAALDAPGAVRPVAPPDPRPPVHTRPRRLGVTAVETWRVDPYSIYARDILRLERLEPIDAAPGPAQYGILVHHSLDRSDGTIQSIARDQFFMPTLVAHAAGFEYHDVVRRHYNTIYRKVPVNHYVAR